MSFLNQELSEEWYSEKKKKKNQLKDIYYADSCTISRNYHYTKNNKSNDKITNGKSSSVPEELRATLNGKSLKSNPQDKSLKSDPQDRRDEENYDTSFSASRQGSLFETSSSLWSQRRDEENQLIENKKDNHKKLSFCDKIMKELVIFIFGEDVIRKNKLAQQN